MKEHLFSVPGSDELLYFQPGWDCRFSVQMDRLSQKPLNNFVAPSDGLVETGSLNKTPS